MDDYAVARETMVDGQVRPSDVTNRAVIDAMLQVPRERFVSASKASVAYADTSLEIAPGRKMLSPRVFAKLLDCAELGPEDSVLDVGCGTGYSSAVISLVVRGVVGIESDEALLSRAETTLSSLGLDNAAVVAAPLSEGIPDQAPFDKIIIQGAIGTEPTALLEQLAENGHLLAVVAGSGMSGAAYMWSKVGGTVSKRLAFSATASILQGFEPSPEFAF